MGTAPEGESTDWETLKSKERNCFPFFLRSFTLLGCVVAVADVGLFGAES